MNRSSPPCAGALIVAGILGIIAGLRPAQPEPPPRPARRDPAPGRWWAGPASARWAALAALAVGVVAGALTGWLVLIVVLPAAVLGLPVLLATSSETGRIARLDGIAEWTRNLSGVLTAGQGLEQALMASLRSTPESVRPQVAALVARLRSRWPTEAGAAGVRRRHRRRHRRPGRRRPHPRRLPARPRPGRVLTGLAESQRPTSGPAARSRPTGPSPAPPPAG